MRILVHGAGAVGGYFGALLARGGHDVTFVARGENLAALRARGLVVRLGSETPRAQRVAEALAAAGVPYELRRDILVAAWEKLAWNAGFNAVTTLTRSTVAEVLAQPASRDLVVAAMEEADAVAVASGVPVRRWRTERVLEENASGLPDFQTSMLQDLLRGRRLEHDALNGAVVRAAARAGVAVPVNRVLVALLTRLDPGARAAT